MKHLIAAVAGVAAAGALVGAAGYLAHKYVTKKKDEYEDLLYTDEMGEDFIIYDDTELYDDEELYDDDAEKFAEAAAEVKDTVVAAAENVKETVVGAFNDVKEAINDAMDK